MKRALVILILAAFAINAGAQSGGGGEFGTEVTLLKFNLNASRLEGGLNVGMVGTFTPYQRFGMGANVLVSGFYLDFIAAEPQHKFDNSVSDTQWNDNVAFCINAGYQIPILKWLRIMPLVGYGQTNEGVTDGTSLSVSSDEDGVTWYHNYKVTPGSRTHYFNYGGGISVQPCKWFSINVVGTRCGIYGGVALDLLTIARHR